MGGAALVIGNCVCQITYAALYIHNMEFSLILYVCAQAIADTTTALDEPSTEPPPVPPHSPIKDSVKVTNISHIFKNGSCTLQM